MQASPPPSQKDFFISYNHKDTEWAAWIAWQLKAAGYRIIFQDWDFQPGANIALEMNEGAKARRTIAVLSDNYVRSHYTQPEWASAFFSDPTGKKRTLVPVRIEKCELAGLLAAILYIDIVGYSEEEARHRLLDGVKDPDQRARPTVAPRFPGATPPSFPPTAASTHDTPAATIEDQKKASSMPSTAKKPLSVFIAFSDNKVDKDLCNKLIKALALLQSKGLITIWHEGLITGGRVFQEEIDTHLNKADITLLLLSSDFIASSHYNAIQQVALARWQSKATALLPIILRPCAWKDAFGGFTVLPSNKKPITSWKQQDEALEDIREGVDRVVDALLRGTYYS